MSVLVLILMRLRFLSIAVQWNLKLIFFAVRMNNVNVKTYLSYSKIVNLTECPICPHII